MHEPLEKIVADLTAGQKVLRINDLWRAVNDRVFGFARREVLVEIDKLGYKKRHVMLYDGAGNKNTLICYVQPDFGPDDKPLIDSTVTAEELTTLHAEEFLYQFRDAWYSRTLPEGLELDPPYFDIVAVGQDLAVFFTREALNESIKRLIYDYGKCTKKGINMLARRVQQLSQNAYMRKNTYSKAANGAPRSRVEDKLIYKYTYQN